MGFVDRSDDKIFHLEVDSLVGKFSFSLSVLGLRAVVRVLGVSVLCTILVTT